MAERKRRTREHIIADLAVNFVERLVLECGYTSDERKRSDYGCDLIVTTFDDDGYIEDGFLQFQVKATDNLSRYELDSDTLTFSIDIRDWRLWKDAAQPFFLILFDAVRRCAYWVYLQVYFKTQSPPKPGSKSVSVRIPKKSLLRVATIQLMRSKKAALLDQVREGIHHE